MMHDIHIYIYIYILFIVEYLTSYIRYHGQTKTQVDVFYYLDLSAPQTLNPCLQAPGLSPKPQKKYDKRGDHIIA